MGMRLKKLKLAGFKSFVDPTSVPLPSNLISIVGPNGCGKSNIIDAVRWVMGESSAKLLRGESMADVIFNGSTSRKPVGQASVELLFDNSDASLGGAYAQYNEISIKRVVSRDGSSDYYLNSARCRRKDITDIFLGTGLGSRTYAIIEQGMISRIIESKPDELRVYLEEAAGISKYKERRKETEGRIQHTRENLERLQDIRDELSKQLDRLERQAAAAERFKVLRQDQDLLQAQLLGLRWQLVNSQLQQQELLIKELQTEYESYIAKQRSTENTIIEQREKHSELQEGFNQSQEHYYRVGSEIARLEESIQYQAERKEQLQNDLKQTEADLNATNTHYLQDQEAISELQLTLEQQLPEAELSKARLESIQESLTASEQKRQTWQMEWDAFNQNAAQASEQAHVQQTNIQHIEQRITMLKQRSDKLQVERSQLDSEPLSVELGNLQSELIELNAQKDEQSEHLQLSLSTIKQLRDRITDTSSELNKVRSELSRQQGRLSSLEALQQAALGKQSKAGKSWIEQQGFQESLRLAQTLEVESGWEKAIEVLLADHLQAICLPDFTSALPHLAKFDQGTLSLVKKNPSMKTETTSKYLPLSSKIKTEWNVAHSLLEGVYVVETLEEGIALSPSLTVNERVVTKDGICIGNAWIQIKKEQDPKAGVLQREQEIKNLIAEIEAYQQQISQFESVLSTHREELTRAEEEQKSYQQSLNQLSACVSDIQAKLQVKQARIEQLQQRQQSINHDLSDVEHQIMTAQEELVLSRTVWQEAMQSMEQNSNERQELEKLREALDQELQSLRNQLKLQSEASHQYELTIQRHESQLASLKQSLQRSHDRIADLTLRKAELSKTLDVQGSPELDLKTQLDEKLVIHKQIESEFKQARLQLEENEMIITSLEKERHQTEQQARTLQGQLEQARMDGQTYRVQCAHFNEQLVETGQILDELMNSLPSDASIVNWEQQLSSIESRIQRLGPINLAAIDEFKTESERKFYLDEQHNDLTSALETLENAIAKIDKETRTRFQETFDKVNANFKTLFPRLFGGGNAQLVLTDDDLLNSGVTVIAKPPGKQNSRIQLLSGGEKAMTAVGLVFAIFQLNPSPFCMLDEVDAPLDDANIGRFCQLVKEMSDKVQFIFITHNKVTMELANHLAGVTMNEPGVSRMVSVDMDTAMSLAEAG